MRIRAPGALPLNAVFCGRRTMTRALAPAVVSVGLAACVGPFSENIESHYPDVATARRQGAFTRGWLPEIVPDGASDIWEVHNIDTNLTWACFSVPDGPIGVRRLLTDRKAERVAGPVGPGPRGFLRTRTWWRRSMSDAGVEAYELRERSQFKVVVGVDAAGNGVCMHRTSARQS